MTQGTSWGAADPLSEGPDGPPDPGPGVTLEVAVEGDAARNGLGLAVAD